MSAENTLDVTGEIVGSQMNESFREEMKHILNVEGIPGAGKSTTAAQLDESFRLSGFDSYWVLEEASDHPIGTAGLRRDQGEEKFASACLESWKGFVEQNSRVAILDGFALQST
ncbi:MAG: hypothetical protein WA888_12390, partial [Burkholderiaceae bacterium]